MNEPAGTEFGMPLWAVAITPLPIVMWPATPTCPASVTLSSIVTLPATPTCAASRTFLPMLTPCATWTRLSILVPAPIRVSPTAGRSMVVLAPISTSSSMTTRADLRDLVVGAVGAAGEAEAVAADHGAVLHDDAMADADALADRHPGVNHAVVADRRLPADADVRMDDRARADVRAVADHRERSDRHLRSQRDVLAERREVVHARRRPPRILEELDGAREGEIRLSGRAASGRARPARPRRG